MSDFAIGDTVTPSVGPMKGLPGTFVYVNEDNDEHLVRFGAAQQLYYSPADLRLWGAD